ncbi:MAG: DUF4239 domain-containing protein [Candidatus Eremiobacteraeota bacterium]|nr:DUF4239 domain-containing protein [Candidatus Eremiobacteraeota bacterium]
MIVRSLTEIPPILAFLLIVAIFNAYALVMLLSLRTLLARHKMPRNEAIASSTFGAIGGFNSLLLALVVVTLWTGFRETQTNVNREAAQIAHLRQDMIGFPAPEAAKFTQALRRYVDAVVFDEWPALCNGKPGPRATDEFNVLQKDLIENSSLKMDATLRSDTLSRIGQLDELRRSRLTAASPVIIPEVWVVLLFVTGLLLVSPVFFNTEHRGLQIAMAAFFATALGAVFFIAARLDYVFCGSTSVSPDALMDVARTLSGR